MDNKLRKFENLVAVIWKLEKEKVRIKNKYRRLNKRIYSLNSKKVKLKKEILEAEACK